MFFASTRKSNSSAMVLTRAAQTLSTEGIVLATASKILTSSSKRSFTPGRRILTMTVSMPPRSFMNVHSTAWPTVAAPSVTNGLPPTLTRMVYLSGLNLAISSSLAMT